MDTGQNSDTIKLMARIGLSAKGVVYCLLGILAFMAAFHINGKSASQTDHTGVIHFLQEQPGGNILLAIVAAGLICYTIWRFIEASLDTENKGSDAKGIAVRLRYFFSGAVYGYIAFHIIRLLLNNSEKSGDDKKELAADLLSKPFGAWLVGIAAAILLGVGIYQIYYGLSEKYKKHVGSIGIGESSKNLLTAGKIGYVARGVVWILIAWLFFKAALNRNSSEAGDSSEALKSIQNTEYGTYWLAAVAIGLCCYGVFMFVRARYERF